MIMKSPTVRSPSLVIAVTFPAHAHTHAFIRRRPFNSSLRHFQTNSHRILDPVRIPPTFHDYLRLCSANNTLLLALFTTSACTPCRTITPLLTSLVEARARKPSDAFSDLSFCEVELDSPDTSNGHIMEIGMRYAVNSMPTLVGFGGRMAERVTERLADTRVLADRVKMERWIDDRMEEGDPYPSSTGGGGGGGGGESKGILSRMFT